MDVVDLLANVRGIEVQMLGSGEIDVAGVALEC